MSRAAVTLGYVPLADAALPILALEMGFAAEEGIDLTLVREPTWSNIRDKIAMGVYPAAHMLSPLAVALSAGVGPVAVPVVAPMLLGTNGNTLTATPELAASLDAPPGDAPAIGAALARVAAARGLRVGVPFPHSMHRELVRFLIERSGGDPARITFLTAPPRILPEVLAAQEVDAFMVGEPWAAIAADRGAGVQLLRGADIWAAVPEKVLALDARWAAAHGDLVAALVRAMYRAALWMGREDRAGSVAGVLALPRYLGAPVLLIERALREAVRMRAPGDLYPWQSAAGWIAERCAPGWGVGRVAAKAAALATFRPDLLHAAVAPLEANLPLSLAKTEGRLVVAGTVPGRRGAVETGPDRFFDGSTHAPDV